MIERNAPPKTVAISFFIYEVSKTGSQKLVKHSGKPRQFISGGHAEDWIAENGQKNKNYVVQKCIQKWFNKN
ncbi:MAG TPA: hypothetical protein VII99_10345 [Bacteroidia bacterium]